MSTTTTTRSVDPTPAPFVLTRRRRRRLNGMTPAPTNSDDKSDTPTTEGPPSTREEQLNSQRQLSQQQEASAPDPVTPDPPNQINTSEIESGRVPKRRCVVNLSSTSPLPALTSTPDPRSFSPVYARASLISDFARPSLSPVDTTSPPEATPDPPPTAGDDDFTDLENLLVLSAPDSDQHPPSSEIQTTPARGAPTPTPDPSPDDSQPLFTPEPPTSMTPDPPVSPTPAPPQSTNSPPDQTPASQAEPTTDNSNSLVVDLANDEDDDLQVLNVPRGSEAQLPAILTPDPAQQQPFDDDVEFVGGVTFNHTDIRSLLNSLDHVIAQNAAAASSGGGVGSYPSLYPPEFFQQPSVPPTSPPPSPVAPHTPSGGGIIPSVLSMIPRLFGRGAGAPSDDSTHRGVKPYQIVLRPDDPSILAEALLAKLTCPICYRAFRRKRHMQDLQERVLRVLKEKTERLSLLKLQQKREEINELEAALLAKGGKRGGVGTKKQKNTKLNSNDTVEAFNEMSSSAIDEEQSGVSRLEVLKSEEEGVSSEVESLRTSMEVMADEREAEVGSHSDSDVVDNEQETTELRVGRCGHLFCERCIKAHIRIKKTCPVCNQTLKLQSLYPLYL